MIRYKLDDLGWYQFEWLVQSLLKADLGIGVQDWGGRGDHGRDAFCPGSLNFPSKHSSSDGPFVFQVKFVESANSAGAKCATPLIDAVRREAGRIRLRTERGLWQDPRNYVLITNAPVEPDLREEIVRTLGGALPGAQVHVLGGNDLCDLLDQQAALRRSFPQLLSLRELDLFIREAVNAEVYEKSKAAISQAGDSSAAFVPTSAYSKAWRVLRDHHFVVLEGPPEMGKTAIAWVIGLAQLANGWQVIAADGPEDFFRCYENSADQVFVADDAFGRTEYDPSRGNRWEAQLHRVYRQLDQKHWLIWTSRKHILERAIRVMDLQGDVRSFPNPAAVLVDAGRLSEEERALILYRHAREAGLEPPARDLIRSKARLVVGNHCFTPERVRRFVQERLADVVNIAARLGPDSDELVAEIREAIENPTERMRKSFRSLPPSHKWALVSLLEAGENYLTWAESVETLYESHCPPEDRRPFSEIMEELSEAFVKAGRSRLGPSQTVDWMHPSYRDLVIDELSADASLQSKFLASMRLEGIKLAISSSGGSAGTRRLPLMGSPGSWELLEKRALLIASEEDPPKVAALLEVLAEAASQPDGAELLTPLRRVIGSACEQARDRWDADGAELDHQVLSRFFRASEQASPLPKMPDLTASWDRVSREFAELVGESKRHNFVEDVEALADCVEFWRVIGRNEPRLTRQKRFPESLEAEFEALLDLIGGELESERILDTADEYRAESQRLDALSDAVRILSDLTVKHSAACGELAVELTTRSSEYEGRADSLETEEPYPNDDVETSSAQNFSIEALFSDL